MILATLCYIRDGQNTLMLHRIKKHSDIHFGKWNGLGGKLLPGESPEECVIREVKEESGLCLLSPQLKGVITFPKFDVVNDWYVFVFLATRFTGSLIDSPEGKLKWINTASLLELELWEGDRIFLKWLDTKRFFSAKFIYEASSLKDHSVEFYPE